MRPSEVQKQKLEEEGSLPIRCKNEIKLQLHKHTKSMAVLPVNRDLALALARSFGNTIASKVDIKSPKSGLNTELKKQHMSRKWMQKVKDNNLKLQPEVEDEQQLSNMFLRKGLADYLPDFSIQSASVDKLTR